MDAGTIDLCPSFCVHFELDTRGAGDGEYEGLSIIVSGYGGGSYISGPPSPPPPSSPPPPELPPEMTYYYAPANNDDLCGELGFWMGYGNSFGFGVQCESEWFTPGLYGEQKEYSVSFCLTATERDELDDGDGYAYTASITVDGDTYTDPSTQGRTWGTAVRDWRFPTRGGLHMLYTGDGDGRFGGSISSMMVTGTLEPEPAPCTPDDSKCRSTDHRDCYTSPDESVESRACDGDWKPIYTGEECDFLSSCNEFTCYSPSCENLPPDVPYHPTHRGAETFLIIVIVRAACPLHPSSRLAGPLALAPQVLIVVAVVGGTVGGVLCCWCAKCCCFTKKPIRPQQPSVEVPTLPSSGPVAVPVATATAVPVASAR